MSKFDRVAAVRRAQRVRDNVVAVNELIETLIEIQECQDWLALGYKTWTEYCEGEFGGMKLTAEQRGRVVNVLVASGMPKRRVAAALGVSDGTVRNDTKRNRSIPSAQNYAPPVAEPQVKPAAEIATAMRQAITDAADRAMVADPDDVEPLPEWAHHCENCNRFLAPPFVDKGERRCINCDADRIHVAAKPGGPCVECAIQASSIGSAAQQTAAEGNGFPPEADGDEGSFVGPKTSPAGSGDASPVAGSGLPQNSPAAVGPPTSPQAGVPAAGGQNEERIEEETVEFHAAIRRQFDALNLTREQLAEMAAVDDFPSLAAKKLWLAIKDSPAADPMAPPSPQQPGQDSPPDFGSEGFLGRAETDHHEPGGEPGSGEAPGSPVPVEPEELEGGGEASLSSPSSEPEVLVEFFEAFVQAIDRVDIEAMAPMMLAADVERLEVAAARIATFVGLIEKYHSP